MSILTKAEIAMCVCVCVCALVSIIVWTIYDLKLVLMKTFQLCAHNFKVLLHLQGNCNIQGFGSSCIPCPNPNQNQAWVRARVWVRHLVVLVKVRVGGSGRHCVNECPHRDRQDGVCA